MNCYSKCKKDENTLILNTVTEHFGKLSKAEIIEAMHRDVAYIATAPNDIIQFK